MIPESHRNEKFAIASGFQAGVFDEEDTLDPVTTSFRVQRLLVQGRPPIAFLWPFSMAKAIFFLSNATKC